VRFLEDTLHLIRRRKRFGGKKTPVCYARERNHGKLLEGRNGSKKAISNRREGGGNIPKKGGYADIDQAVKICEGDLMCWKF